LLRGKIKEMTRKLRSSRLRGRNTRGSCQWGEGSYLGSAVGLMERHTKEGGPRPFKCTSGVSERGDDQEGSSREYQKWGFKNGRCTDF